MIGDKPLVDREIGYPAKPDFTRAPGLRSRPFDGVVEIDRLRERPRLALARRFSAAAPVDPYGGIALRHPPLRVNGFPVHQGVRCFLEIVGRNPQLVFLVGTQIQNRGKPAGGVRAEHIGFEARAVAHRHVDVVLGDDAIGRRRGGRLSCH
jgi:hypothetical protein